MSLTTKDTDNIQVIIHDSEQNNNVKQKPSNVRSYGQFYMMIIRLLQCFICLFSLAIFAGVILYYTFAIIGLVDDKEFLKDCPHNLVWIYVLVCLINSACNACTPKQKDDDGNYNLCSIIFLILTNMGLAIWGTIILSTNECDGIKSSTIWTFTIVNVVLNFISLFFTFLLMLYVTWKLITVTE